MQLLVVSDWSILMIKYIKFAPRVNTTMYFYMPGPQVQVPCQWRFQPIIVALHGSFTIHAPQVEM